MNLTTLKTLVRYAIKGIQYFIKHMDIIVKAVMGLRSIFRRSTQPQPQARYINTNDAYMRGLNMSQTVKMKLSDFANTPYGIFSTLQCGNKTLIVLEPEWDEESERTGCIKAGIYDVVRIPQDGEPDIWQVLNVPGRNDIHLTFGFTVADTNGSLLLGTDIGCSDDRWCVRRSETAMHELNNWLDGVNEFRLYIERRTLNQSYN